MTRFAIGRTEMRHFQGVIATCCHDGAVQQRSQPRERANIEQQ